VYPIEGTGGSVMTVTPPAVRTTKQDWPIQVMVRSPSSATAGTANRASERTSRSIGGSPWPESIRGYGGRMCKLGFPGQRSGMIRTFDFAPAPGRPRVTLIAYADLSGRDPGSGPGLHRVSAHQQHRPSVSLVVAAGVANRVAQLRHHAPHRDTHRG